MKEGEISPMRILTFRKSLLEGEEWWGEGRGGESEGPCSIPRIAVCPRVHFSSFHLGTFFSGFVYRQRLPSTILCYYATTDGHLLGVLSRGQLGYNALLRHFIIYSPSPSCTLFLVFNPPSCYFGIPHLPFLFSSAISAPRLHTPPS